MSALVWTLRFSVICQTSESLRYDICSVVVFWRPKICRNELCFNNIWIYLFLPEFPNTELNYFWRKLFFVSKETDFVLKLPKSLKVRFEFKENSFFVYSEFLFARYGKLYEPRQTMVARCTMHPPKKANKENTFFPRKMELVLCTCTFLALAHVHKIVPKFMSGWKELRFSQSSTFLYGVLSGIGVVRKHMITIVYGIEVEIQTEMISSGMKKNMLLIVSSEK